MSVCKVSLSDVIGKNSTLFFHIFFLVLGLSACSPSVAEESKADKSLSLNSPFLPVNGDMLENDYEAFCIDPTHFANLVPFKTKTKQGSISIELLFDREWDYLKPAVVSKNPFGEEIDRKWIMGDDFCYNGTDSGKNPVIKIEKSGRVSCCETNCYSDYGFGEITGDGFLTIQSETHCYTSTVIYQIQLNGIIDFVRKDTVEDEL